MPRVQADVIVQVWECPECGRHVSSPVLATEVCCTRKHLRIRQCRLIWSQDVEGGDPPMKKEDDDGERTGST